MSAALTLAPMSPGVAKAWHALQAEMLKETHGLDVVPPGAIVLQPRSTDFSFHATHDGAGFVLSIGDQYGNGDRYTKRLEMPDGWENFWNPAHWRQQMTRVDSTGREWHRTGSVHVMDDFGYLVEVPK